MNSTSHPVGSNGAKPQPLQAPYRITAQDITKPQRLVTALTFRAKSRTLLARGIALSSTQSPGVSAFAFALNGRPMQLAFTADDAASDVGSVTLNIDSETGCAPGENVKSIAERALEVLDLRDLMNTQ